MDHTYASAMVGAQKKYERKPADFYPTPWDATVALLDFLALPEATKVLEPACGDGSLSRVLESYFSEGYVTSTELRLDSGYGKGGVDFLRWQAPPTVDWVITNPPFKLAEAFIIKALEVAPNVAMLLKSQYWHAKTRLNLFETYPPAYVLPLTWRPSFLEAERGRSPLMDVIWVVWKTGTNLTEFYPLRRPSRSAFQEPFSPVKKNEIGTLSLTDARLDGILINEELMGQGSEGNTTRSASNEAFQSHGSQFDLSDLLTIQDEGTAESADLSELLV